MLYQIPSTFELMKKNSLTQNNLDSELLSLSNSQAYARDMARLVDMNDPEINFSALAQEALAGEEIIFSRDGNPALRLVRMQPAGSTERDSEMSVLPPGAWAHYDPDFDFDAWDALDEDVRKLFTDMP